MIPGPRSAAEVEQNAALMQAEIPGALWPICPRRPLAGDRADTAKMIRVDAHHHVWSLARGDYGWIARPARFPAILRWGIAPLLERQSRRPCWCRRRTRSRRRRYLLDVAKRAGGRGERRGRLGRPRRARTRRPASPRLARIPLLKGVRPMLQDLPKIPAGSCAPRRGRTLAAMPRLGLRFDALVRPRQLPASAAHR